MKYIYSLECTFPLLIFTTRGIFSSLLFLSPSLPSFSSSIPSSLPQLSLPILSSHRQHLHSTSTMSAISIVTLVFTIINAVLLLVATMCLVLKNNKKNPPSFQLTDYSPPLTDSDFESRQSAISPMNHSTDDGNDREENVETDDSEYMLLLSSSLKMVVRILSKRLTMKHEML